MMANPNQRNDSTLADDLTKEFHTRARDIANDLNRQLLTLHREEKPMTQNHKLLKKFTIILILSIAFIPLFQFARADETDGSKHIKDITLNDMLKKLNLCVKMIEMVDNSNDVYDTIVGDKTGKLILSTTPEQKGLLSKITNKEGECTKIEVKVIGGQGEMFEAKLISLEGIKSAPKFEDTSNPNIKLMAVEREYQKKQDERGTYSLFPSITFRIKNVGVNSITPKQIVCAYSFEGKTTLYLDRIPFNKKILPGKSTNNIRSTSKFGLDERTVAYSEYGTTIVYIYLDDKELGELGIQFWR